VFGDDVTIAGALSGDPACTSGRIVDLEFERADESDYTSLAETTTAADGSYSFTQSPEFTGRFRTSAPATDACPGSISDPVLARVKARVDATLLAGSLAAGSCLSVDIAVSPAKPGQDVTVQRRTPQGWTAVDTLQLDDTSAAASKPCFGWEDIGVVRLRARWQAQDVLNETNVGPQLPFQITEAAWMQRIDSLTSGRAVSVAVGDDGAFLYEHADAVPRTPASNEKLLLSMALLDGFGASYRTATVAAAPSVGPNGVVRGDLWILGRGDPEIGRARMSALAERISSAGITAVRGRVMGARNYFRHDWWATGWKRGESRLYVAPTSALTFDGNVVAGTYAHDPEALAAESLVRQLQARGIAVRGKPGSGRSPAGLTDVATISSRPMSALLRTQNIDSRNFYAEELGKLLGAVQAGPPGTIAKGAAAIEAWASNQGVPITAYDSSGLSYSDRVTARGIVELLWAADAAPWGGTLRASLPSAGQGTLEDRLRGVRLRAKTGSLDAISALSGWVWSARSGRFIEFSILSAGMSKDAATAIEDRAVRILARSAR
jgi:D-alanyl-D-alanine carboxypeptidase/D-alanyl-D-alanine-endopeptidase (penicillin-binding protein 4)